MKKWRDIRMKKMPLKKVQKLEDEAIADLAERDARATRQTPQKRKRPKRRG